VTRSAWAARNWRGTTMQAIVRACPTPRRSVPLVAAFSAACRS
jgi:hypothetical protein